MIWGIVWLGSSGQITKSLFFSIAEKMTGNISLQRHHTLPQEGIWSCFTKLLFTTGCTGFFRIPRHADTNTGRRHLPELDVLGRLSHWIACLPSRTIGSYKPGNKPVSVSTSAALPRATTRLLCLDELGFHDAIALHRQFPICPNQNGQIVKDWHIRQQTARERLSRYTEIQREPSIYAKSWWYLQESKFYSTFFHFFTKMCLKTNQKTRIFHFMFCHYCYCRIRAPLENCCVNLIKFFEICSVSVFLCNSWPSFLSSHSFYGVKQR